MAAVLFCNERSLGVVRRAGLYRQKEKLEKKKTGRKMKSSD